MRSKKPTLIACRTIIGLGAPHKAGTNAVHGSPLGAGRGRRRQGRARLARTALHRPAGSAGTLARRGHPRRRPAPGLAQAPGAQHPCAPSSSAPIAGKLPENWHEAVAALKQGIAESKPKIASRAASQRALEALVPATPELVGGSADLTGSNLTFVKGMGSVSPGNYAGRYIHFGVREHGMCAAANGMALHGGLIPYTGTFFVFTDYMRPAIRMGAIMRQRVIHVLTHDSIGLGEDGPTHQPIEHLASLRAMPNLHVFRPATRWRRRSAGNWRLRRTDGPSLLVLSRQACRRWRTDTAENRCARGGYVLAESGRARARRR